MDKKPQSHGPRPVSSMDGFIPNRRGRVMVQPFSKTPNPNHSPAQPPKAHTAQLGGLSSTQAPITTGVSWNTPAATTPLPKLDPERNTGRQSFKDRQAKATGVGKKKKIKKVAFRSGIVVAAIFLLVGGYIGFKFFHNIDKVFGGNIISNIGSLFGSTTLRGENTGRVNILLAGDSADDPNHAGANLTDSIMLVSINTKNNTGFMLSIPRDLWVNIPSVGQSKINAANTVSNFSQSGYPAGGMGQLEQVVNQDLGIPVDYYALIDYAAFRDSVNAVGGITVNIKSTDPRGLFDPNIGKSDGGPLKLPNGNDFLNGQTALNLARARGDPCFCGQYEYGFPNSDFDRTQHQRQELVALAQKATSAGVLSNPVKLGSLFDSVGNNVQTDLNLADVIKLAQLAKAANLTQAQSLTYSYGGSNPLLVGQNINGQDALVPKAGINNFTQLQLFYQKLTSNNPVIKESATVVIENGGSTSGLAKLYQSKLTSDGVDVVSISDTLNPYTNSEIMDNSGGNDPATKALLEKEFGKNIVPNNPNINTTSAKFVVIIGQNQGPPS